MRTKQTATYWLFLLVLIGLTTIWSASPLTVQAQPTINEGTINSTFAQLGYEDIRLQGLHASRGIWLPFSDWAITGDIQLELTYVGSPLLNRDTAIVTVLADGREVTSFRPVGDGREVTTRIIIPQPAPDAEGINLTFTGHLRLTDDPCEDSFNIGQWLIVRNSSRAIIELADEAPAPRLSDLPGPLLVQGSSSPPLLIFVLPNEVDEATLTVAAQVAQRLGPGVSTDHLPLRVKTAVSLTENEKKTANLVVVGLRDNNPLIDEISDSLPIPPTNEGFVSQDDVLIPAGDGVIQITNSPWQPLRHVLLLSGNDAAGLQLAGEAFAHQPTFQSLTDSFYFINNLVDRPELALLSPWTTPQTSFAQLGESTRQITGQGIIDSYYFFRYPPGVLLGDRAQLVLHLAFSPALSGQQAYAEVYVNEIYIGDVQATDAGGDAWVSLDLPTQALNQLARTTHGRNLELRLSVANLLPVDNCDPVNVEGSWTKVYADSYFAVGYQPVALPDLYFFPYPHVSLTNETPARLVLPTSPNVDELQVALSVAALIGNQAVVDTALDVVFDTAVTPDQLSDHHLIFIGTTANHTLLAEVVADLQVEMPGDIYQIFNEPRIGFFHTLASPWNSEHTVLAIYGQNRTGLRTAANSLYQTGWLVTESGSMALVAEGQPPEILYRAAGLTRPQLVQPNIIVSEISQQPGAMADPAVTAAPPDLPSAETETDETADSPPDALLTSTERIILIITAFLVVLVIIAVLLRIAWRIRA
jgi:hypothetical protein